MTTLKNILNTQAYTDVCIACNYVVLNLKKTKQISISVTLVSKQADIKMYPGDFSQLLGSIRTLRSNKGLSEMFLGSYYVGAMCNFEQIYFQIGIEIGIKMAH